MAAQLDFNMSTTPGREQDQHRLKNRPKIAYPQNPTERNLGIISPDQMYR